MKLLSVIIPVYNTEKYLRECLDSLLNQTYPNIEIICVNDGSTDNSLNILNEYAQNDFRIKIINQKNKGQSAARNNGLKVAAGDYITFIDSDDFVDLDTYKTALSHIEQADIVCFGCKVFGNAHKEQRNTDNEYYRIKYSNKKVLNDNILIKTDCSVCNKIFKKEIIDKYKINFPEGIHYEDAEFYFKYMSVIKDAYFINEYFYHYRRHKGSIMSETFGACDYVIEHLYIVKNIYEYWQKLGIFYKKEELFVKMFKIYFSCAYDRSQYRKKNGVLKLANIYANKFKFSQNLKSNFIKALKEKKYNDIWQPDLNFYQQIFCIKSFYMPITDVKKKLIVIFGLKIKTSNRLKELERRLNRLQIEINEMKSDIRMKKLSVKLAK